MGTEDAFIAKDQRGVIRGELLQTDLSSAMIPKSLRRYSPLLEETLITATPFNDCDFDMLDVI